MKFIRKVLYRLKNPSKNTAIIAFIVFACAFAATIVFLVNNILPLLAHFLYFLSAVTFFYCVYIVVLNYKTVKLRVRARIQDNEIAHRFTTDYNFRSMVFTAGSFLLNVAFAVYYLVYGIIFREIWHISLGAYYMVLLMYRGVMLFQSRKINRDAGLNENAKNIKRVKIYRTAGMLLFAVTFVLVVIVWLVRNDLGGFRYYGITILVTAVYTVFKVVMAVNNMIKVRKSSDYVVHAARNINLVAALVSLFALQTAMLSAYGDGDVAIYNAAFGTAICAFCTGLAILMIVRGTRELKKINSLPLTPEPAAGEEN